MTTKRANEKTNSTEERFMNSSADPHAEIVRMIAENKEGFQFEQVEALFIVTCEDLILGGVDHVRVEAAMLRGWVRMQVALLGARATAATLREFAELIERPAGSCSQNSERLN